MCTQYTYKLFNFITVTVTYINFIDKQILCEIIFKILARQCCTKNKTLPSLINCFPKLQIIAGKLHYTSFKK